MSALITLAAPSDNIIDITVIPILPVLSEGSRYSVIPISENNIMKIRNVAPKVTIATTGLKYLRPLNRARIPNMISIIPNNHDLSEAYLITGVALNTGQPYLDSKVNTG
jgi:hypothetical protein